MNIPYLTNQDIVIATMHGKEQVIAPILEEALRSRCVVAGVNTDQFGTFSGEIPRELSPLEAARQKCIKALEITGKDLCIASEGSFGPHPYIPFAMANEELVLLYNRQTGAEFVGSELTTITNMSGESVSNYPEALHFARRVGFPRHALIIRKAEDSSHIYLKGVTEVLPFRRAILQLLDEHGTIWLETDMRAMYNPTRMQAIERATRNLIQKIKSRCPNCSFPGYWIDQSIPGLPCSLCGSPTRSLLGHIYRCKNCDHQETKYFPNKKMEEDPMYCDYCNP